MFTADDLPTPPEFSEDELRKARETNRYEGIFFEWYKFVAQMAALAAAIDRKSQAYLPVKDQHSNVLIGLINRCARLMLANLALSHKGKFGETTAIIDRCVFESALKAIWLSEEPVQEKFDRYLADGLKKDLELMDMLRKNIEERGGQMQKIEERMIASIQDCIKESGLSEEQVRSAKKLPDIASLLEATGFERIFYISAQRMGSHHVHGTWTSLISHYLEKEISSDAHYIARGNDVVTHSNQFAFSSLMVLKASRKYCHFVLEKPTAKAIEDVMEYVEREIIRMISDISQADMELTT